MVPDLMIMVLHSMDILRTLVLIARHYDEIVIFIQS